MIRKLRRRMTLLVSAVLILVTAGIVFSINYMNWRNITIQAENALETLAENAGVRPGLSRENEQPPDKPENGRDDEPGGDMQGERGERDDLSGGVGKSDEKMDKGPVSGQPPQLRDRDTLATLSNYYVVTLAEDGSVSGWTSDREFLYSDEQVQDMASLVAGSGEESGRIGTQFYKVTKQDDSNLLIVLDERLEITAAKRMLRTTALIAASACLLLCIGAWFLIRFMVRPVQDAFDRQRQFVWDASHELKTPLAVIGANAQALEGEIGRNESLDNINGEVQRTGRMIQNLLTLAKTDRDDVNIEFRQVDLGNTVLSAVLPMESSAFDEGRTFDTQIGEGVFCQGDEDMLRQLTVILLSNALKYSDAGSVIRVSADRQGKSARLQVSNLGDGIAPEDREKIFDRFYRADASHSREVEGHGLGLAIARNIVEIHKGKISVTSDMEENGRYRTTFTVLL